MECLIITLSAAWDSDVCPEAEILGEEKVCVNARGGGGGGGYAYALLQVDPRGAKPAKRGESRSQAGHRSASMLSGALPASTCC